MVKKLRINESGDNSRLSIKLDSSADFEYRSHINGMRCTCPDNWVSCGAIDSNGDRYTCWYFVSDDDISSDSWELSDIDYDNPDDIEDSDGNIVYDSEYDSVKPIIR